MPYLLTLFGLSPSKVFIFLKYQVHDYPYIPTTLIQINSLLRRKAPLLTRSGSVVTCHVKCELVVCTGPGSKP